MSGDRTSQASTLPLWEVEKGIKRGTLNIRCPRCKHGAIVVVAWLKYRDSDDRRYIGRSCTYCFKVAQIPEELRS